VIGAAEITLHPREIKQVVVLWAAMRFESNYPSLLFRTVTFIAEQVGREQRHAAMDGAPLVIFGLLDSLISCKLGLWQHLA
jgi:hypothetical protein